MLQLWAQNTNADASSGFGNDRSSGWRANLVTNVASEWWRWRLQLVLRRCARFIVPARSLQQYSPRRDSLPVAGSNVRNTLRVALSRNCGGSFFWNQFRAACLRPNEARLPALAGVSVLSVLGSDDHSAMDTADGGIGVLYTAAYADAAQTSNLPS